MTRTFLTAEWVGIRKIGGKDLPWESILSDYRDVQGLKFPFKIEQGSPGTDFTEEGRDLRASGLDALDLFE